MMGTLAVKRLNNEFVFRHPELPAINIRYGWSEISDQLGLCCFMFSFVISSNLIIICIILFYYYIQSLFFLTRSLFLPYAYIYIESIDCILLSSFELKTNLLSIFFLKSNFFSKNIMPFTFKSLLYF